MFGISHITELINKVEQMIEAISILKNVHDECKKVNKNLEELILLNKKILEETEKLNGYT